MNDEVDLLLEDAQEQMEKAIGHLEHGLIRIRAGRATVEMLDGITVDYYGSATPLAQVANVGVPDGRTISIQPWEKPMIAPIERAILEANLGFNPQNNGEIIRINVPILTEDRRKDLVKSAKAEGEHAKVSLRSTRRDVNDELKKMQKDGLSEDMEKTSEEAVQKLTDDYSRKIDVLIEAKESDIMTI